MERYTDDKKLKIDKSESSDKILLNCKPLHLNWGIWILGGSIL